MSEVEQRKLEDQVFTQGPNVDLLAIAEDELIDSYVRKELSPQDHARFSRYFLTSARREERVRLATLLMEHASSQPHTKAHPSWRESLAAFLIIPRAPVLASMVCLAIVLAVISGILSRTIVTKDMAAEKQQKEQEFRRELQDRDRRSKYLAEQLRQEQVLRANAERELSGSGKGPTSLGFPSVLSFVLTPGSAVRGVANGRVGNAKTIVLPRGSHLVSLQLRVNPREKYSAYRIVLRTADNKEILSENIWVNPSELLGTIPLALPASVLAPGDYSIEVAGAYSSDALSEIESFVFSVIRK